MLPVVNVVGDYLHAEIRQLIGLLWLHDHVCLLGRFKMIVLEGDILLDPVEIAIDRGKEPARGHNQLHPDVSIVGSALNNPKNYLSPLNPQLPSK